MLKQDLSLHEPKPNTVTQQCIVQLFKCNLCDDAGYIGYTKRHLHTCGEGHGLSIYKHYFKEHNTAVPHSFFAHFNVITKSSSSSPLCPVGDTGLPQLLSISVSSEPLFWLRTRSC